MAVSTSPVTRKKLYFDFAISSTATRAIFPCTQFRAGLTCGDRYAAVLDRLEALTGSSNIRTKEQREVTAFAIPVGNATSSAPITFGAAAALYVDFIGATSGNGTGGISRLPFLTIGGPVFQKAGQSAVFGTTGIIRDFAVRVRRPNATTGVTIHGVVYVQRQHAMEV